MKTNAIMHEKTTASGSLHGCTDLRRALGQWNFSSKREEMYRQWAARALDVLDDVERRGSSRAPVVHAQDDRFLLESKLGNAAR